jgi:hypothetical protein
MTGVPGQNGLSGRDVVFTLDRGYRKPLVTRGAAFLVLAVIAAAVAALGIAADVALGFAAAFGVVAIGYAVRYTWTGRFRTRLSAEGIRIQGYFNHFVPWSEVTGVEATGVEATGVTLSGAGGRQGLSVTEDDPSGRPGAGLERQLTRQDNDTSGFRGRMATVRVARAHGRHMLLRAPLVTAWQADPEFGDKVRTIRQWWQACNQAAPR